MPDGRDPLAFLLEVVADVTQDAALRIRAAGIACQYMHRKIGDAGKKEERGEAAKRRSLGKFAASAPPKLVVNNR